MAVGSACHNATRWQRRSDENAMAKIIKKEHSGVSRPPTGGGSRVIKAEHTGSRSAVIKVDPRSAEGAGSKIIKAQGASGPVEGDTDVAQEAVDEAAAGLALEDTEALDLPEEGGAELEDFEGETDAGADELAGEDADVDGVEDLEDEDAEFEDEDAGDEVEAGDPAATSGAPAASEEDSPYAREAVDDEEVLAAIGADEAELSARALDAAVAEARASGAPTADPFSEPSSTEELPLPREGSAVHRNVLPRENSAVHRNVLPRENSALHTSPFAEPEATPELPREQSALRRRATPRNDEQVEGMARSFIARAQNEARALHEAVEQEIAQALADAETRGHAEGRTRMAQLNERVEHLAEGLLKEVEPQAVEAAIAVARQLIDAELKAHPEAMVAVVRQALMSARQQRDVYIRVNPVHAETLRAHKREVVDVLGRAKDIDVREDPDLEPGGCMVETEIGTIDARLETQFEALVRHLTGGAR